MTPPAAPTVVPYITAYENEKLLQPRIVRRRDAAGIAYADETPYDRDLYGVLWERVSMPSKANRGEPRFMEVNPFRQRRAMLDMLCQVCGKHTESGHEDGSLFLFRDVGIRDFEGMPTSSPPVHPQCAQTAVEQCPMLRDGHVAVWVEYAPAWGVSGTLFDRRTLQEVPADRLVKVPYGAEGIAWVRAARFMVSLHGCRRTTIEAELARR